MPVYRIEHTDGEVSEIAGRSMSTPTNKVEFRDARDYVVLSLPTDEVNRIEELDMHGEVVETHWGAPRERPKSRRSRDAASE